ncbi:cell division topological specificity factor MinE [Acetobacteraceae bacterium]|nr:cell division topological specificity factor MinE [Acetobacteraceae bacterium]
MIFDRIFGAKKPKPISTSSVAKERLQILLTHERGSCGLDPELLLALREDIVTVVEKYFPIDRKSLNIDLKQREDQSGVEIDIGFPKGLKR